VKVKEALPYLIETLSQIEDEREARREALEILAHLLEVPPLNVYLHLEREVLKESLEDILRERLKLKPLPYILKRAYFFKRTFYIEEGVLIPRPETELLIEVFLDLNISEGFVLELGCGSGIISITLLLERQGLKAFALDISEKALKVTSYNAKLHGVSERLYLVRGDWFSPLKEKGFFKAIVSNPPYISLKEWKDLSPEVREFEPIEALLAGARGTEFQEALISYSRKYLCPEGFLIFEMGYNQASKIKRLAQGWEIKFFKDLQNFDRVALLWKKRGAI